MPSSDDEYNPRSDDGSAEESSAEESGIEKRTEEPHGSEEEETDVIEQEDEGAEAPSAYNPNRQIEANWKFVRGNLHGTNYKIQTTVNKNIFGILKTRLESSGQEAVAAFRASAFGVYYEFPDLVVKSGRCINYVFNREVKGTPDPDPDAMWFQIEDEIVRFSKVEFALVTGLRFGAAQFNPYMEHDIPRTSVYTRRFGNERMTTTALWKKFSDNEWNIGTAEDCVKLCKVMIAAMVVLGNNPNNWKIPDWIWVLVEDAQQWDQFPWGSLSYQVLRTAVLKFNKVKRTSKLVHLHTNTIAIMGWIYSAFPELGSNIGGLRPDYLDGTPRALKYFYRKKRYRIQITRMHGVLEPTDMEQNTDYYRSLEADGISFKFEYEHYYEVLRYREAQRRERFEVENQEARPSKRLASDEAQEEAQEAAAREEAERQAAQKRKRKIEDLSDAIVKKLKESDEFMETLANKIVHKLRETVPIAPAEDQLNSEATNDEGIRAAVEILLNVAAREQYMPGQTSTGAARHEQQSSSRIYEPSDPSEISIAHEIKGQLATGMIEEKGVFHGKDNENRNNDFDLSELNWDPMELESFKTWMGSTTRRTRSNVSRDTMQVPADLFRWVEKKDMAELMSYRGWLHNYHIDALLSIAAYEFDMQNDIRDWAILDMPMTNLLLKENFDPMSIGEYVSGQKPSTGGKPWQAIKRIFGCANFDENHWVLFQLKFEVQQLIVYDSMNNQKEDIVSYFHGMARNIPEVLQVHRVWESTAGGQSHVVPLRNIWDIDLCSGSPQQPNTFDCGVFCIKVLECITRNVPFDLLRTDRGAIYRHSYCAKLWKWHMSKKGSDQ